MNVPESRWRDLLDLALPALDVVFGGGPADETAAPRWSLGGGTAIAWRIDHRISHDVDLFVPGTALKRFTPRLNPAAALISPRFQYPGHYLKFERADGEIDFLSAPMQTAPGTTWIDYRDRRIALETLEEVVVKKIRFRSARFTARDTFDLAAVAGACPDLASVLAREVPDALPRTRESVGLHAARGSSSLREALSLTQNGEMLIDRTFEIATAVIDDAMRQPLP